MEGQSGKALTAPCAAYFKTQRELANFTIFVGNLAEVRDEHARRLAEAALGVDWHDDLKRRKLQIVAATGAGATATLKRYRQLILEMTICRQVDNFLCYVSDLLALVFRTRPQTLRSKETERLDFILGYETMDDLISALAEKRVEALAYNGLRDLADYISGRLGLALFENEDHLKRSIELVEIRNVIVHNRGIANRHFLQRAPDFRAILGEPVELRRVVPGELELLSSCVLDIDARASKKFDLGTPAAWF